MSSRITAARPPQAPAPSGPPAARRAHPVGGAQSTYPRAWHQNGASATGSAQSNVIVHAVLIRRSCELEIVRQTPPRGSSPNTYLTGLTFERAHWVAAHRPHPARRLGPACPVRRLG